MQNSQNKICCRAPDIGAALKAKAKGGIVGESEAEAKEKKTQSLLPPPAATTKPSPLTTTFPVPTQTLLSDDLPLSPLTAILTRRARPISPLTVTCFVDSNPRTTIGTVARGPTTLLAIQRGNDDIDVLGPFEIDKRIIMVSRLDDLGRMRRQEFRDGLWHDVLVGQERAEKILDFGVQRGLWLDPWQVADVQASSFALRCREMARCVVAAPSVETGFVVAGCRGVEESVV